MHDERFPGDDRSGWTASDTTGLVGTQFFEGTASFSPDGRWLAYTSDESGQYQVFVRSFPDGDGKKQVSVEGLGSAWPFWSATDQELIFATAVKPDSTEMQIFTAKYRIDEGEFMPERPVRWEGASAPMRYLDTSYNLHPDGQRLLVSSVVDVNDAEQAVDHVVLFENFFGYLREHVPISEE